MTTPSQNRERTQLAWDRTALAAAAFGALLVKVGVAQSRPLYDAAGVVGLVGALGIGAAGRTRVGRTSRTSVWLAITATAVVTGATMALTLLALLLQAVRRLGLTG